MGDNEDADQLSDNKSATLAELWSCWPGGLLRYHDRAEPEAITALVVDGYIEATDANEGVMYRLAEESAKLEAVSEYVADQASAN